MKKIRLWVQKCKSAKVQGLVMALAMMMSEPAMAQFTSAPAFPGAEGYGRYTTGGRGGKVIHVTRLDDYIDNTDYSETKTKDDRKQFVGTLRYALSEKGPRIVVFDVAGTIELKCPLRIKENDVTILGQTAPGDGICLKNYTMGINANNVIVRYIRCRMGDEGKRYWKGEEKLSNPAFEDDAMNSYHKDGQECQNIIIDHCSLSWCVDECGTFYGNKEFTLQWCILSESLRMSVHDKGAHGYGGIWGGSQATFHHNLLADHDSRNPRFDHGYVNSLAGPVDYINNVVYNWGSNSSYGGETFPDAEVKKFNMVNNYYKAGPATKPNVKSRLLNPTGYCTNCNKAKPADVKPGQFYLKGNVAEGFPLVTKNNYSTAAIAFDKKNGVPPIAKMYELFAHGEAAFPALDGKFNYNTVSTQTAEKAFEKVLAYAGASLKRDAVDERVTSEAKSGTYKYEGSHGSTGGMIDTPNDVGGWPVLKGTAEMDTDKDGIPDSWEKAHGLDPKVDNAATFTLDKKGYYTDLEVYANYLVQETTKAERADAGATFEEYYPMR